MFKVGEIVVHKRDVCKVTNITKNYREGEDFYKLSPISDNSLTIFTPVSNERGMIRKIISKAEAKKLIERIPEIEPLEAEGRALANEYKALVENGEHDDLIRIIKTAHIRNAFNSKNNKKPNENDKTFFRLAESILYSELATALGMELAETRGYVVEQIVKLAENEEVPVQDMTKTNTTALAS